MQKTSRVRIVKPADAPSSGKKASPRPPFPQKEGRVPQASPSIDDLLGGEAIEDPAQERLFFNAVGNGVSLATAAGLIGLTPDLLKLKCDEFPEFEQAIFRARAIGRVLARQKIASLAEDDFAAAVWLYDNFGAPSRGDDDPFGEG
jgi:hypothetical protein